MMKKYVLYLIRWQLGTPILAIVLIVLADMNTILVTIIANFIGGLMSFWIDKFIFKNVFKEPLLEIKENIACTDCNNYGTGYRVVQWYNYDRVNDTISEYRCKRC